MTNYASNDPLCAEASMAAWETETARREKQHDPVLHKSDLIALTFQYGLSFVRDPVTGEGTGVYIETSTNIPVLDVISKIQDELLSQDLPAEEFSRLAGPCIVEHCPGAWYRIICPKAWIDLDGWH